MDVRSRIEEIERALSARGVSVAQICRMAGLNQTTWVRWKNGVSAQPQNWARVETAIAALGDAPQDEAA